MKKVFYLFLVLSVLSSCAIKTNQLRFSKFEITDKGVSRIMVDENGIIKRSGSGDRIGKINKNGTFNDKDGNLVLKITDDNFLQNKDGKKLIKIDANGKMDNGSGMYIEWSESGELLKGNKKTGMRITPVDKKSFRAASTILFIYLSDGAIKTSGPISE